MPRVQFYPGRQSQFIRSVFAKSNQPQDKLGELYGLSSRTLRDWAREKLRADYSVIKKMAVDFRIPLQGVERILDDYWYVMLGASKGGLKRVEIHGPPGNPDGWKKGGTISQQERKKYPEKYRRLGCVVRKEFTRPKHSEKLAEVFGILLGDGAITDYQTRISLDNKVDREYAMYVSKLFKQVFGEEPTRFERKSTIELTLSGIGLVETLESLGLQRGNKIRHQISIPHWILGNTTYSRACVRGLFDTDGGFYSHDKGKRSYMGWTFCSRSAPLLEGVAHILLRCALNAKKNGDQLYLYSFANLSKFMDTIGSSNPKNVHKFEKYKKSFLRAG